jgi:Tfp pilus assembly protein PilN
MQAVNLLPSAERPTLVRPGAPKASGPVDVPVGALTVLAVLVVAIVAVALHVQGKNVVKDREAELAAVTAETQAVEAQSQQLQRYQDFQALAATRAQTVGALARGRFEWAPTLRDVARVLPGDAYLSGFCADAGAGGCETGLRSAIPNASAIAVTGCTRAQAAVATLMTRLRDVRGVTRVSLDSSVAAEGGKSDGDTACPSGDPPTFSIVAFFERDPVGTAGQANPAGATAAATPTATPVPAGATPTASPTASPTP